jgi:NAD(P)-dependent dehydrogenase (short-subunit alcohol dehydrogenase family)
MEGAIGPRQVNQITCEQVTIDAARATPIILIHIIRSWIPRMAKLAGKVAIITGGESGLGLASAKLFASEGAQVIITGRKQDMVEQAAAAVGCGVLPLVGDAFNLDDLDRLYAEIGRRFGHLDIVLANPGLMDVVPIPAVTPEQFAKVFNTDIPGLYFAVQKALPLLRDGSSIILASWIANGTRSPESSLYDGAKAAVSAFVRSWSNHLQGRKIRVNSLSLGLIEKSTVGKMSAQPKWPPIFTPTPRRIGTLLEIARTALFLASDDSLFINGTDLGVDNDYERV